MAFEVLVVKTPVQTRPASWCSGTPFTWTMWDQRIQDFTARTGVFFLSCMNNCDEYQLIFLHFIEGKKISRK